MMLLGEICELLEERDIYFADPAVPSDPAETGFHALKMFGDKSGFIVDPNNKELFGFNTLHDCLQKLQHGRRKPDTRLRVVR
jgi:hypothetical protein